MSEQQQRDYSIALTVITRALQARAAVRLAEFDVAMMIGQSVADAKDLLYTIESYGRNAEGPRV
jgi:hypothetical protein